MQTPRIDTVRLSDDGSALVIIDQTLLPGELKYLSLTKTEDIWEAIRALRVRGAPAIGVAAGFGAYLAAKHAPAGEAERSFYAACDYLATSRPTAVNLFYALERMRAAMGRLSGRPEGEIVAGLRAEAQAIMDDDLEMSRRMGEHGRALIKPGMGILTHCNAGHLRPRLRAGARLRRAGRRRGGPAALLRRDAPAFAGGEADGLRGHGPGAGHHAALRQHGQFADERGQS